MSDAGQACGQRESEDGVGPGRIDEGKDFLLNRRIVHGNRLASYAVSRNHHPVQPERDKVKGILVEFEKGVEPQD